MIVKNDSIHGFLKENIFNYDPNCERQSCNAHYSVVQLLDDTIHLKKDNFKLGDCLFFELDETTQLSNIDLITSFEYIIVTYDDVSFLGELQQVKTCIKQ